MRKVSSIKVDSKYLLSYDNVANVLSLEDLKTNIKNHVDIHSSVKLNVENNLINFLEYSCKANLGTTIAKLKKAITFFNKDFEEVVTLKGVGYKFILNRNFLVAFLGHSHTIFFDIPSEITLKLNSPESLLAKSKNLMLLKTFSKTIQSYRYPEPYKGKGVYLNDQKIVLKPGKTNK